MPDDLFCENLISHLSFEVMTYMHLENPSLCPLLKGLQNGMHGSTLIKDAIFGGEY